METPMLNRNDSYELKPTSELKKGDKIPLVSDTMFHVMINNESRKKYFSIFNCPCS
ncbi:MAG: hypothetical protein ACI31R_00350 [Bacilli bacterium]